MLTGMPRPRADLDTQPFWDGVAERRFLVPTCGICETPRWPPGPMCPSCQSQETEWRETDGTGTVYSWVVVTHPVAEALVEQVPYAVGLIELPEGVRVVGNVLGVDPSAIRAGMPVRLVFEDAGDGALLPNWTAEEGAS